VAGALKVLIVDDHQLFSDALVRLLDEAGIHVTGTARSVAEATQLAGRDAPDVVLVDYLLPDGDGPQAMASIRSRAPNAKVVIVTALNDDATLAAALDAGCDGFVTKDRAAEDLLAAVAMVQRGEIAVRPEHLTRALAYLRTRPLGVGTLTKREREVVAFLAEGLSNADIGRRLSISTNTVRNHMQSLLSKLGARSRLEAVAIAARQGLVRGGPPTG
jgi:DNA-binding NarL/FixJ family response regulator